jgi:hypothetical protein
MCKVPGMYRAALYGVPQQREASGLEGEIGRDPDGGNTGTRVLQHQPDGISTVALDDVLSGPADLLDDTTQPGRVVVHDVQDPLGEGRPVVEFEQAVGPR